MDTHSVVVVEDDDDYRTLVCMAINQSDTLKVIGEADDGLSAIGAVGDTQPDLVLLDVRLPRMDGIEALAHIREVSPRSRVVVCSAFASREIHDAAIQGGAFKFVAKAVWVADLVDALLEAARQIERVEA